MAKTTRKTKQSRARRVSRLALDREILEIHSRLTKLRCEVESIEAFIKPNDAHTSAEHQTRSAMLILVNSLHQRISSVHEFADMIVDANEVRA